MSIFGNILDKIFHHSTTQAATPPKGASQPTSGSGGSQQSQTAPSPQQSQTGTSSQPTGAQPNLQNVDIEAVLGQLASTKGGAVIGEPRLSIS